MTLPVQQMHNYQALSQKIMSNCQKVVKSQKLLKYKPHKSKFELSSKLIFTKNPNPGKNWGGGGLESEGWGGGGGGGGGGKNVKLQT